MNSIINPNADIIRVRITEEKWAEDFLKKGSIKFNTPSYWVSEAEKHGEGRGDFYEGTKAFQKRKEPLCHLPL